MSNVIPFPRSARVSDRPPPPDPTTPEGWKTLLFDAGNAVILAQMNGGDVRKAREDYAAVEARLPADVREALTQKVNAKEISRLVTAGWDFLTQLLDIKSRY